MKKNSEDNTHDTENIKNNIPDTGSEAKSKDNNSENKVTPDNIQEFLYPKKDHLNYFNDKGYSLLFYGEEINEENANIKKYRNLLSYSFITENVNEGSNILEISDDPDSMILNHFKLRYDCYKLSDIRQLEETDTGSKVSIKLEKYPENNTELNVNNGSFHFIIWNSTFGKISDNKESLDKVLKNAFKLLKPGGYILFLFDIVYNTGTSFIHNGYFNLFNLDSKEVSNITWYKDHKSILEDQSFIKYNKNFSNKNFNISRERKYNDEGFISSYNVLLRKKPLQLRKVTVSRISDYRKKTPSYIYHHLMKCGGTSVTMALQNWFKLELDHIDVESHRIELNHYLKYKLNLENINSDSCIISHFHFDGTYLHQRYPEVLNPDSRFRIFTFVREPLAIRASLYYYERKRGGFKNLTLKSYINSSGTNFLARLFPCDESDYKEVLDRYFFIGITEKMQESIDKLGKLVNGKKIIVPVANTSQKDKQLEELGQEFIDDFRKKNKLGYLIYDYCLEKFNKL
ncbi:MAG TPA: hypothetical protein PKA90_14495 [Ignavibacteria bacterium]|nr:hypothetical protein [Ignavibacteria bacterium]HMR41629.1 hypothetical protein [Ignavibacteria bacterium]